MAKFLPVLRNTVKTRPWMTVAIVAGLVVFAALPGKFDLRMRMLLAWNFTQWIYIVRILVLMFKATPERIRRTAIAQDESAEVVLGTFLCASLVALVAIVFELVSGKGASGADQLVRIGLPLFTLLGVWLIVPMLFAVHYAHEYYCAPKTNRPIRFPDDPHNPSYWDFLYFSITIAVAAQTADVVVTSSSGRKLVMAQEMVAFLFNTTLLALTINIAAGLLS